MHTPLFIFYSPLFAALFAEQYMLELFSCQFQRENLLPCADILHFLGLNALFWNLGVIWQPLSPSSFMASCHTQIYLQSHLQWHGLSHFSSALHKLPWKCDNVCPIPPARNQHCSLGKAPHRNLFLFLSP